MTTEPPAGDAKPAQHPHVDGGRLAFHFGPPGGCCPRRYEWFQLPKFRPPCDGIYLVYTPGFRVPFDTLAYVAKSNKWMSASGEYEVPGITHWMHLPEPPR